MFIQKVKTPGLAHLSYIVGSNGEAAVIDPRRDIDEYVEIAKQNNCRIKYIFETHRNEDLISGAPILADLTGAEVKHGPNPDGDVQYADIVHQGETFEVGNITFEIVETPGHTKDSISILLFDKEFDEGPAGIFTGDTLFIGDVGRTDFYPDEAREVAGMLFDSLRKIEKKADTAIVYPAHGAGSVCGDGMAEREFSTVAHEMENNPMLKIKDKQEFIQKKVEEHHYQAPYFEKMEHLNLVGASPYSSPRIVCPIKLNNLDDASDSKLVDIRSAESFVGVHYPGSLCLPLEMVTAYGGWLLDPEDKITLIADSEDAASKAALQFARIGYDSTQCYVPASFPEYAAGGGEFASIDTVSAEEVKALVQDGWRLLDVRKITEYEQARIEGSEHIFLGHLPQKIDALSPSDNIITMCASGMRASVAAGYLRAQGFKHIKVFMGSIGAWKSKGFDVVTG